MKLKTSLQLSAVFPILLAIVLSLGLFLRTRPVNQARASLHTSETLIVKLTELESSLYAYLLHKEDGARQRWQTAYDDFGKLLGNVRPSEFREEIIVGRIKRNHDELRDMFGSISALAQSAETDPAKRQANQVSYKQLEAELSSALRDMTSHAFDLASAGASDAVVGQEYADKVFAVLTAIIALLMTAATIMASRSVVNRLASLKEGTSQVTAGNLNHRINIQERDEVGDLFQSFNEMVRRLQQSDEALRKESEERKRIADALRDGNSRLSDALGKLRYAQHQAIHQERLRALEQIARGVAHDFNNALTPILGTSDFLLTFPKYLDDRQGLVEHLQTISNAAKQARNQVRRISDFFRAPPAGDKTGSVNLNDVVTQTIEFTEPRWKNAALGEGVHIQCQTLLSPIPPASGNEVDMKEALTNLVLNAIEAMPSGGAIQICTRSEDKWVVVEVKDTGRGMSEEVLKHCLEPFYSTKGRGGSGMGLTAVAGIVKRSGGMINVESETGKGTTVTLRLPVYGEQSAKFAGPQKGIGDRKLNILVIDDQPNFCETVSRTLTAFGHSVCATGTAEEGLKKVAGSRFDLVLLDRALPDKSGDNVAVEIKRAHPNLPIILFTGFGDIMEIEGTHPQGVDRILSKPAALDEMMEAINGAVALYPARS